MDDITSWVSVAIATGSLVVAIVAMTKANAVQRRIVEIEEQRDKHSRLESARAKLCPELRQMDSHSNRLYLVNRGQAEARNVRVEMDGKPLAEHPASVR